MFIIGYQLATVEIIWKLCSVQNPEFWTQRPLTERMKRAAADDVRFLLRIRHMMLKRMGQLALWQLGIRGSLYCRCFCKDDDKFQAWPGLPGLPGLYCWSFGCTRILFFGNTNTNVWSPTRYYTYILHMRILTCCNSVDYISISLSFSFVYNYRNLKVNSML